MGKIFFPDFKEIDIDDREIFYSFFKEFKPEASEYTFTNLFIWRRRYRFKWSIFKDWLFIVANENEKSWYGFQPVGPEPVKDAVLKLLEWLKDEKMQPLPSIQRCEKKIINSLTDLKHISIEPKREHFDYVYLRDDLVRLEGNRYRSKRNHINKLKRLFHYRYEEINGTFIKEAFKVQEKWCQQKRCRDDMNLMDEWSAVEEALNNFFVLNLKGGVIVIDSRVVAFTIGEMLNEKTAVVHIEKADPDTPGLYPLINQKFCEYTLKEAYYVNREQDLGIEGLREAKLSYHPHHFVEKFDIILK